MKKSKLLFLLAMLLVLSISLTACSGLIPPKIGETGVTDVKEGTETQDTTAEPAENGQLNEENPADAGNESEGDSAGESAGGEGDSAGESAGDSAGDSSGEPAEIPEMMGNVIYRFYHEEMKSTSLGGMEQFTAEALLYDELNAGGQNGVIHLTSGSSETYITCVWTDNGDGSLNLQVDEFTIYNAKEVEGVLTVVGVRYSLGMMNNGTVDIPLAQ